jgi:polyhydroxyalkanoate synthase
MMQLIHYEASTAEVYRRPLLYIPPLVNKYYVLDLQPRSSMIKWLVDQGHDVFVISWVNPGPELSDKGISDYCLEGPVAALEVIERATGERAVDVFGFCMGGTLLAITAAYLNATGQGDRLGSLSMIGTLLDFTDTGEWATFYEPGHMDAFERHVQKTGVIAAEKLQALFSVVRANDLIWSSVVSHYLLDREAPASDLLFWFADGSRIPQAFLLEYGKALLRGNLLKEPGGISVGGVPIDLKSIQAPACLISLKDDHVSGWRATYAGARLFGGETMFLLGGSGHNAGVINPPAANKHGYWVNPDLPDAPEQWMEGAEQKPGSWWPAWQAWLADHHGEKIPARGVGTEDLPVIEPAPGSYVLVK